MANKKITQLTASSVNLADIDLIEGSINNGVGVFTSKKLTGQQVYDGVIESTPYICAYAKNTQTFAAATATPIVFGSIAFSNFIAMPATDEFETARAGFYQIDFNATIFNNGGNPNHYISFFLKINGTNVVDSSKLMNAPTNSHVQSYSTSWLVQMALSDVVSIICVMELSAFELLTESAFTGVTTPNAQLIMKKIG